MTRLRLNVCLALVVLAATSSAAPLSSSGALQVLQQLGLDRGTGPAPSIVQGQGKRRGDSPIYYIKLPPLPYYFVNNNIQETEEEVVEQAVPQPPQPQPPQPQSQAEASSPLQKLPIDFTNNGRPNQVYHWNTSPTSPISGSPPARLHQPTSGSLRPLHTTTTTTTTTTTEAPTTTTPKPTKKPFVNINKYFPYNGRPSNVYVWKPKLPVSSSKYKHYFTHFNY
ncbi:LOW QUALITY PROTEIN: rho GTPase-activating protein gacK-like [Penaeus chinensis]|uniref:LOW QUALITY PROTEIN: rho GTPase-activating protein gacK-like n=1 Tax=Penaeus chinensis TaxID=139456 RepID=UPI001FB810F4|nr:LOW QUALITY PROTEIN: rho GTPase-activating protein gacK-like [Penaeus chinensis]